MSVRALPVQTGTAVRTATRVGRPRQEGRAGWGLAAPFLIFYLLFLIGPTVYGIVMSFFNTYWVQVLPAVAVPIAVFIFVAFFNGIPAELAESARVDGAGWWRK